MQVDRRDRDALERLCRYVSRSAIATERLSILPDGRVRYSFRKPWKDGTTAVVFSACGFLEKLAALIPPPRANLVTYHGVFAPNAALRSAVVSRAGTAGATRRRPRREQSPEEETRTARRKRYTWAELLKRVFGIDALVCPQCGGRREPIAVITSPSVIRAILECLHLFADPPPVTPPQWPP